MSTDNSNSWKDKLISHSHYNHSLTPNVRSAVFPNEYESLQSGPCTQSDNVSSTSEVEFDLPARGKPSRSVNLVRRFREKVEMNIGYMGCDYEMESVDRPSVKVNG